MISAIVYGRNDNYSYALDRRTALGLNQLSRHLVVGKDEIVFVDYNTDNDLPSYPEAISDTLTQQTIDLVRVIRVRPEIHAATSPDGPPVREAFCRNIALRRLRPENQWVLSTNPDCLLLSPSQADLHTLSRGLPNGYFGLPRYEIPRLVWETFPRSDPVEAARLALHYAEAFALNECVEHYLPEIGYDGPGDFQLTKAEDLRAIGGFNEAMTQGWHVDSNLNARLALLYGQLTNFNEASGGDLCLYHTEHSRRISAKHQSGRSEDSFEVFVEKVGHPVLLGQVASWGAPEEDFEEFKLARPPSKQAIFDLSHHVAKSESVTYVYGPDSFNQLPQAPDAHLAAFLADHLVHAMPGAKIGWLSEDLESAERFRAWIERSDLELEILDLGSEPSLAAIAEKADTLCLVAPAECDFRMSEATENGLVEIISSEYRRQALGEEARRVIGLNIPHSQFEETFMTYVSCALTPVSSRIRFGEVKALDNGPMILTDDAKAGPSGEYRNGKLTSVIGDEGYMAMVKRPILPGKWRLDFKVGKGSIMPGKIVMDVALDAERIAHCALPKLAPWGGSGSIEFESDLSGLFGGFFECRLWVDGKTEVTLEEVILTSKQAASKPSSKPRAYHR